MSSSLSVSADIDDARWDAYVHRARGAALYHLSGWKHVMEEVFGHPTHYLSALSDHGEVVGVLPLVNLRSRLFGNMMVSLPYFNYAGPCSERADARALMFEEAVGVARNAGSDFLELRDEDHWNPDVPTKTTKVAMRLALPASADALWKTFPAKLRNQVQRPRKSGMTDAVGREDQLDAFFDVFSRNMRDLGTPVYPKSFFHSILQRFPKTTHIVTVYAGARPVAAGFLAGFRDRLEIPWASSLRAFNRQSPNMLLYWSCLKFACDSGYRVFDFGRSTTGESTYRFKEQWGASPHQLYWHYWLRNGGDIPQVNPANPKYRAAIRVWQHVPLPMTRWLGPRLVKYIP
jgi:serine/alanine adding enzyme